MKRRGPGDLFGIRQSGDLQFKLGNIYNDAAILKQASECVLRHGEVLKKNGIIEKYLHQAKTGALNCVDFITI